MITHFNQRFKISVPTKSIKSIPSGFPFSNGSFCAVKCYLIIKRSKNVFVKKIYLGPLTSNKQWPHNNLTSDKFNSLQKQILHDLGQTLCTDWESMVSFPLSQRLSAAHWLHKLWVSLQFSPIQKKWSSSEQRHITIVIVHTFIIFFFCSKLVCFLGGQIHTHRGIEARRIIRIGWTLNFWISSQKFCNFTCESINLSSNFVSKLSSNLSSIIILLR